MKPRENRPTPKAKRTRKQILDTSLVLFKDKGFDNTSMREIAAATGMSVGTAYYYFRSKDELVLAFYKETQEEAAVQNRETIEETTSFDARFKGLLRFKLQQLTHYRNFFVVLVRTGVDPNHPLSPFSPETKEIREAAIELIRETIRGSDIKVDKALSSSLPRLLWLYQMGIIYFWSNDHSPEQRRTHRLLDLSISIILGMFRLSTMHIPGVGKLNKKVQELLAVIEADQEGAPS